MAIILGLGLLFYILLGFSSLADNDGEAGLLLRRVHTSDSYGAASTQREGTY